MFNPLRAWRETQEAIEDAFEDAFSDFRREDFDNSSAFWSAWAPACDVKLNQSTLTVQCDLPGVSKEDVRVDLHNNVLSIRGERKYEDTQEHNNNYRVYERSFGSFARQFSVPNGVRSDSIKAKFDNGTLRVDIPVPPEAQPKRIEID